MTTRPATPLHLLLIRHAKSSWQDTALGDHDRPLAPRGLRDAPDMADRIARHARTPEIILCSSALRAQQTAHIIAEALAVPEDQLLVIAELYLASADRMLDVIRAQPDQFRSLAMVGHNPGMTDLVNALLRDVRLDNLPTTGVMSILSHASHWDDIAPDNTTLDYYDFPKKAR